MKITYRIPTEMYAYVEVEENVNVSNADKKTVARDIQERYNVLSEAFKPQPINSLSDKEFQTWLVNQLLNDANGVEEMEKMSPQQKWASHEIKKALATIKRRHQN